MVGRQADRVGLALGADDGDGARHVVVDDDEVGAQLEQLAKGHLQVALGRPDADEPRLLGGRHLLVGGPTRGDLAALAALQPGDALHLCAPPPDEPLEQARKVRRLQPVGLAVLRPLAAVHVVDLAGPVAEGGAVHAAPLHAHEDRVAGVLGVVLRQGHQAVEGHLAGSEVPHQSRPPKCPGLGVDVADVGVAVRVEQVRRHLVQQDLRTCVDDHPPLRHHHDLGRERRVGGVDCLGVVLLDPALVDRHVAVGRVVLRCLARATGRSPRRRPLAGVDGDEVGGLALAPVVLVRNLGCLVDVAREHGPLDHLLGDRGVAPLNLGGAHRVGLDDELGVCEVRRPRVDVQAPRRDLLGRHLAVAVCEGLVPPGFQEPRPVHGGVPQHLVDLGVPLVRRVDRVDDDFELLTQHVQGVVERAVRVGGGRDRAGDLLVGHPGDARINGRVDLVGPHALGRRERRRHPVHREAEVALPLLGRLGAGLLGDVVHLRKLLGHRGACVLRSVGDLDQCHG